MLARISLVVGYLPGLDRASASAKALDLPHRRALVLRADAPNALVGPATDAVVAAFLDDLGGTATLRRIHSILDARVDLSSAHFGPVAQPTGYVCASDGRLDPGPAPYLDGLTLNAYTSAPPDRDALVHRVQAAADAHGVPLAEVLVGDDAPRRRWFF